MQKLIRAGFGNNNVDTCARVCHSPTGYGLATTFGTSAGTQDFDSVEHSDVIMVIGANPTDAHPVFASRMKKRLRAGRQADRGRSAPHRAGAHRRISRPSSICRCCPAPTSPCSTALAHVIVTEGLVDEAFVRERCDWSEFQDWARLRRAAEEQPRSDRDRDRRRSEGAARRGAAVSRPAATARSITGSASPSTARARPR